MYMCKYKWVQVCMYITDSDAQWNGTEDGHVKQQVV